MATSEYSAISLPGYIDDETELMSQLTQLDEFGNIDSDGNFIFNKCSKCKGPALGHKDNGDMSKCLNNELTTDEIEQVILWLETNELFQATKNQLDLRLEARICTQCNKLFKNKATNISHQKNFHKKWNFGKETRKHPSEKSEIDERLEKLITIIEHSVEVKRDGSGNGHVNLVKNRKAPIWTKGQDFESYCHQLRLWEAQTTIPPIQKYFELLDSLKTNREIGGLAAFVARDVIEKVNSNSANIIEDVINLLKDKFQKTIMEKMSELVAEIQNFEQKDSETGEDYLNRYDNLLVKLERANFGSQWKLWTTVLFLDKSKMETTEKISVKKQLKNVKDNMTVAICRNEFKELKIENQRSERDVDVFFTSGRNRLRSFSRSRERYHNRRSYSRSKDRRQNRRESFRRREDSEKRREEYAKKQDLTEYGRKPRSESREKRCRHECCAGKVDNTRFVSLEDERREEVEISEIYITNELNETEMIIDSGAPKNIAGIKWIEEYLKKNKFEKGQVTVKRITKKKFKFGPSKIYECHEVFEVPLIIKGKKDGTEFNRLRVQIHAIDANVPFLCSKEQLQKWSASQEFEKGKEKLVIKSLVPSLEIELKSTEGNHLAVVLERNKEYSEEEIVMFAKKLESNEEVSEYKRVKKVHLISGHKGETQLLHLFKLAGVLTRQTKKVIQKIIKECIPCQKYKKSLGIPKVAIPTVTEFNQKVTVDLKHFKEYNILWIVDAFTRFITGVVLKNKEAKTVLHAITQSWCEKYGYPTEGFWADNGLEFQNKEMESLASAMGITIKFGPTYSPWSNGLNERNHYSADLTVKKVMEENSTITLEEAVSKAAWHHNTNITVKGYAPLQLLTGKAVIVPGITSGNIATESVISESEAVRRHIENQKEVNKEYRQIEYGEKLKIALNARNAAFNDYLYTPGEKVFYQHRGGKQWFGPASVEKMEGRSVWILANGDMKKVASCHLQPYGTPRTSVDDEKEDMPEAKDDTTPIKNSKEKREKPDFEEEESVTVGRKPEVVEENYEKMFKKDHLPSEIRPKKSRKIVMTFKNGDEHKGKVTEVNKPNSKHKFKCLLKLMGGKIIEVDFENDIKDWKYLLDEEDREAEEERETKENVELDNIGTYWMKMSNDECLVEKITTYVVEIPKSRHHEHEVIKAKEKELDNFKQYEAIEEVKDIGQETIGSRWVVTEKERQDGQKTKIKARLVARGFQETEKPKSDSPTALRESFKTFIAVSANEGFELKSVDITAAFLQAEKLERDVFVEPPKDIKKEGFIWKLKKPIYGLEDAGRKFWLKVDKIFKARGMKTLHGDSAFYYLHDGETLQGMILCHVDDFSISGKKDFVESITGLLKENFTISKVESSAFRFTGIDIVKTIEGIEVSMEDYAQSIEEIKEIRKAGNDESLTKTEYKVFRKYAGKIQWLAENVRPDLAIVGLNMSMKNKDATIGDLKKVNKIVKKVKSKESKMKFGKIGKREDLKIYGLGDASYKCDSKSIGGNLILVGNKKNDKVSPIYWKTKTIKQVCHSAKDAETRNLIKLVDDSVYLAKGVEQLIFGDNGGKVPVKLFTDSRPTLESIASSKQVERKLLRNAVTDLKEKLIEKEVESYSWLDSRDMIADILTKECKENDDIREILIKGKLRVAPNEDNLVHFENGEFKLENTKIKEKGILM